MNVRRTSFGSRILAMLLVAVMVIGMVPTGVFAADTTGNPDVSSNADTILSYAQDQLNDNHDKTGAFGWDTEKKSDGWRYFNGVMLEAFLQNGLKANSTETAYSFAQNYFSHYINDSGSSFTAVLNGEYSGAENELDAIPPARVLAELVGHVGFTDEKYVNAVEVIYKNTVNNIDVISNTGGNFLHKPSWTTWKIGLDGIYMAQPFLMEVAKAQKEGRVDVGTTYTAIADGVYDRLYWVATNMKYETAEGVYLYHHGVKADGTGNGVTWSRGTGWWLAGLADCIELMEEIGYDSTKIATLKGYLKEAIDGMLEYQDSTGLWYNVIYVKGDGTTTSNNFKETSGTGLAAYTIMKAYTHGWLTDASYANAALKAIDGIMSNTYSSGSFGQILKSSGVGTTVDYYNSTKSSDEAKGTGPIIMAAAMYDDVKAMVDGGSKYTETFQIGAVNVTELPVVNGTVSTSGLQATVVGSKGTIKDVVPSDGLTAALNSSNKVEISYNGNLIATVNANVISDAPVETEGTLTVAPEAATKPEGTNTTDSQEVTVTSAAGTVYTYTMVTGDTFPGAGDYVFVYSADGVNGKTLTGYTEKKSSNTEENTPYDVTISGTTLTFDNASDDQSLAIWEYTSGGSVVDAAGNYLQNGQATKILKSSQISGIEITPDTTTNTWAVALKEAYYLGYDSSNGFIRGEQNKTSTDDAHIYIFKVTTSTGTGDTNTYEVTLTADQTGYLMNKGSNETFSAALAITGSDIVPTGTIAWSTSNADVASVDSNGKVTANAAGDAVITAKVTEVTISGVKQTVDLSVEIPVKVVAPTEYTVTITLEPGALVGKVGDTGLRFTPSVVITDANGETVSNDGFTITYNGTIANTDIAEVDSQGLITLKAEGTTTFTQTVTVNGTDFTTTADILVQPADAAHVHSYTGREEIKSDATCTTAGTKWVYCSCGEAYEERTISAKGHSYTSAVTTPATCTSEGVKTLTCSVCGDSKTEAIAMLAHTYGTNGSCTVCGAADPGYTAPSIDSITAPNNTTGKATVTAGGSLKLTANTSGNATTIYWYSSNEAIATVDQQGNVTGIKAGTVTITATFKSRAGDTATFEVTVYEAGDDVTGTWVPYEWEMQGGSSSGGTETTVYKLYSSASNSSVPAGNYIIVYSADGVNGKALKNVDTNLGGGDVPAAPMDVTIEDGKINFGSATAANIALTVWTVGSDSYVGNGNNYLQDGQNTKLLNKKDNANAISFAKDSGTTDGWLIYLQSGRPMGWGSSSNFERMSSGTTGVKIFLFQETTETPGGETTGGTLQPVKWAQLTHKDYTVTVGTVTNDEVLAMINSDSSIQSATAADGSTGVANYDWANASLDWGTTPLDTTAPGTYTANVIIPAVNEPEEYPNVMLGTITVNVVAATACEHANTEIRNQKDATCGEAGYTGDTYCTDCGNLISSGSEIAATGNHSYDNGVVTTDPTCTNQGVKTFTCSGCNHSYTETVDALDHSWNDGEITTAPTCTSPGEKTYTCQNDNGHIMTEEVAALGHTYGDDDICDVCGAAKAPTSFVEVTTGTAGGETKYFNATEIVSGNKYVLLRGSALGTYLTATNSSASVTWGGNATDGFTADAVDVWTIQSANDGNYFYIISSNGQYLATTTSTTAMQLVDTASEAAKFTVTITDDGFCNIVAKVKGGSDRVDVSVQGTGGGKLEGKTQIIGIREQRTTGGNLTYNYYATEALTVTYDQGASVNVANDISGKLVWWTADDATGTNAAKLTAAPEGATIDTSSVKIGTAGEYTAKVMVGETEIGTVKVVVNHVDNFEVSGSVDAIFQGETPDFSGVVVKNNGVIVTEGVTFGTVDTAEAGTKTVDVLVNGTKVGEVTVEVKATTYEATLSGMASMLGGSSQTLTATLEKNGTAVTSGVTYTYSIVSGDATITDAGVLTAGTTAGTVTVKVVATDGTGSAEATFDVTILVPDVTISGKDAITEGTNLGEEYTISLGDFTASVYTVAWTVTGLDAADYTISDDTHTLTVNNASAGSFTVNASVSNIGDSGSSAIAAPAKTVTVNAAVVNTLTYELVDEIVDGEEYVLVAVEGGKVYAVKNTSKTDNGKVNAEAYEITEFAADMSTITFGDADAADLSEWTFTKISNTPTYNANNYLHWLRYDGSIMHGSTKATIRLTALEGKGQYKVSLNNNEEDYLGIKSGVWNRQGDSVIYIYKKSSAPVVPGVLNGLELSETVITVANGETPDFSAITGTAKYDNSTTKDVNNGNLVFDPATVDTTTPGDKTVTVSYTEGDVTVSATLTVRVPALTGITLVSDVLEVENGGTVDFANNVVVNASYDDGTTKRIPVALLTFVPPADGIDTTVAGDVSVTVSYTEGGITMEDTLTVRVADAVVLTGLTIEPSTLTFANGALITYEDLVFTAHYSDGTSKVVTEGLSYTHFTSDIDNTVADTTVVGVRYTEGSVYADAEFSVIVEEAAAEGFFLDTTGTVDWDEGQYLIVFEYGGKYYALTNDNGSEAVTQVTIEGNQVVITEEAAANMIFTFSDADGSKRIYNDTAYIRNDNGVLSTTKNSVAAVSTINAATGAYGIQPSSGRYLYMSSTSDVKRSNSNVVEEAYLYKWTGSSASGTVTLSSATLSQTSVEITAGDTLNLDAITMTAVYSNNSQKKVTPTSVDTSAVRPNIPGTYTVTYTYTEGGKTVTAALTVVVAEAQSGGTTTSDEWKHNFTVDGKTDDDGFFSIEGSTSTSRGTCTYNDISMDTALKMESSTDVHFTAPEKGTFTLVFGGSTNPSGKTVKINGTSYTVPSDGVLTIDVEKGTTYTVEKGDSINLFYMEYASAAVDGIVVDEVPVQYLHGAAANPTYTLGYTVRHNDAVVTEGYTITWEALNPDAANPIATVENGVLTAQNLGTVVLRATVTMDDGTVYTGTTMVTVRGPSITAPETMDLMTDVPEKTTGLIGATAEVGGETTANVEFGYYVPDEGIVEVDPDGTVHALGKGTTTIYTFIKSINGHTVYTGDGSGEGEENYQPPYYAETVVTVTNRELEYVAASNYDFFIPVGSTQADLEQVLAYESGVTNEYGISGDKGLLITGRYNDGSTNFTIPYGDAKLTVDLSEVDYNTVGVYTAAVTGVNNLGKVVYQDTIWIHVVNADAATGDGYYSMEDNAKYYLDTDGLDANEEYVLIVGNAALKNSLSLANSYMGATATVNLGSEMLNGEEVEVLTFASTADENASVWLLDTPVRLDNGNLQVNASNLSRYLSNYYGDADIVHAGVDSVEIVEKDASIGEYYIILGYDIQGNPHYLTYTDGVWHGSTEPMTIDLYMRHIADEDIGDYKLTYDLHHEDKKVEPTESVSVPAGMETTIEPVIVWNGINEVTNYVVTWSSSDESIATVDANGVVHAVKEGEAVITATLWEANGNDVFCGTHSASYITRTAKVTVTKSDATAVLSPNAIEIGIGSVPNLENVNVLMDFEGGTEFDYYINWNQLTFDMAKATDESGNVVGFDRNTLGVYNVPVYYGEQTFNLKITVVEDPYAGLDNATAIPGFPDAGSVRMNKTATGVYDFSSTGVVKLELTAAGVSTKSSVDVVLITDVSNSMGWDITKSSSKNDADKIPSNGASGTDKLDLAMAAADTFADILLNVPGGDNTVSFVTFAGADAQHGDTSNVDSVRMPMIGIEDYATASSVFAATKFTSLTVKSDNKGVNYKLQIGGYDDDGYGEAQVSGTNRGNTNYDFAFGKAAEAVEALKAKWEAANPGKGYEDSGRQIHVVFMTDGAPSHYNGKNAQGTADTLWDGSGKYSTGDKSADGWLSYISTHNTQATTLFSQVDGFYNIGFDLNNGGFGGLAWNEDQMGGVLRGLVKNYSLPVTLASDEATLNAFYSDLAKALAYAGTNGRVTDKIGNNFSLFTGVNMYSAGMVEDGYMNADAWNAMANYAGGFPVNILSYRLVTAADLGQTLNIIDDDGNEATVEITAAHYGLRVNEAPQILETITFNEAGTEAYSSLNDDGVNIMVTSDGVTTIDAHTFTYTRTPKLVNGQEITDEEIVWKIGDITEREVSMQYYAYLEGSLDNPRPALAGTYQTNEYAYAEYIDVYGDYVKREYGVPQVAWGKASVTVRFYLVNENGQFVNRAGVTFTNPANRIFLTGRAHYEAELGNSIMFTASDAMLNANLEGNNVLYDPTMALDVANGNNTGSITWTVDGSKANIANLQIGRDNSGGSFNAVVIDIPVVMTDLGEAESKMFDATVVIDFSNSVQFTTIHDLEKQANGAKYSDDNGREFTYSVELVGLAPYNSGADLKDFIPEQNWGKTYKTAGGTYEIVEGTWDVKFTPNGILNGTDKVFAVYKFEGVPTEGTGLNYYYMYKQVNVVPANVMHYETSGNMGAAFDHSDAWSAQSSGTAAGASQSNANSQYGFDTSYEGCSNMAGGSALYIENTDSKATRPSVKFTFTGTGIDIISKTGENQGRIKMTLTGNNTGTTKTVMVLNKGVDDLWQIPVLSVENLPYDTYSVEIVVYAQTSAYGGQFYFDAIQVYGAAEETEVIGTQINTTNGKTENVTVGTMYEAAGESKPQSFEIRDILLGNSSFGSVTIEGIQGAVYIDGNKTLGEGSSAFNNYDKIGPNNEVYLSNTQAIAFKLRVDDLTKLPTALDIGLKSVNGSEAIANIHVYKVDENDTTPATYTVSTSTAMFYDILGGEDIKTFLGESNEFYVVISNVGTGTLSVTDLKVGYGAAKGSVNTVVDIEIGDVAAETLAQSAEVVSVTGANLAESGNTIAYSMFTTTLVVVTGQDAQSIKVTDSEGKEIGVTASFVDAENGARRWRVLVRFTELGENQVFTVSAIGSNGEAHETTQNITIDVQNYAPATTN